MERSIESGKINNRFILIDKETQSCFMTDLGQMCKAHDIKRNVADARYVELLLLHDWCSLLPGDVLDSLAHDVEAVCATQTEGRESAVRNIVEWDLPTSQSAEEIQHNQTYFIALGWIAPIESPAKLFECSLKSAADAVGFVIKLSTQLGEIYKRTKYLRPAITIENLAFVSNGTVAGATKQNEQKTIVLADLGFDNFLDRPHHDQDDQRNDVHALASLLVQLLDGVLRAHPKSQEAPIKVWSELRNNVDEVQTAYATLHNQETVNHQGIEPTLWNALYDPSGDFASFGKQLKDSTQPSLPPHTAQSAEPGQSNAQAKFDPDSETQPVVARPEDTLRGRPGELADKRDDKLIIHFIEGTDEIKLHQALNDEIVLLGDEKSLSFAPNASSPEAHTQRRRKEISDLLTRRRVYIKYCHNEGTSTEYYTITDLATPSTTAQTVLNGYPLSPLFAALLTNHSVVEIGSKIHVTLHSAISGHAAGWIAALAQNVPVLEVMAPNRYLPVEAQATSITVPLKITNPTRRVERLAIFIDGMPPDWPVSNPITVPLFEKETVERGFTLSLPSVRLAGEYRLVVRLISDNIGAQVVTQAFNLIVPPQTEFTAALQPESIRAGDYGELQIQNAGNFNREFSIIWRDRANELRFEPQQTVVALPPFYTGAVSYRTALPLKARRLIGTAKRHDISVMVAARPQTQGAPQTVQGQVISRPLIPLWAPLLVAALFVLYVLLFPPGFAKHTVEVDGNPVAAAHAGNELSLTWNALNTCLYSVARNGELIVPMKVNRPVNQETIVNPSVGDRIDIQLLGCSLVRTRDWVVEVADAPPTPPSPPMLAAFSLHTMNVVSHGPAIGGPSNQAPPEDQQILLLGQTGDLCIRWQFTEPYIKDVYALRFITEPKVEVIERNGAIEDLIGDKCFPIAATFRDINENYTEPRAYFIKIAATNTATGDEDIFMETKVVQVFKPYCMVNAGAPLWIREGPGRDFPIRGELRPQEPVFPVNSPLQLNDQTDNLYWAPVAIRDDPRPGWIAADYLDCPVSINVLPVAGQVPPTPTPTASPTPTPTPQPTATPQPTPAPMVAVEPKIINANDCALVTWSIQGVKEVYLDGEGVAGESERQVCPKEPGDIIFIWTIVGNDGSTTQKSVTLRVNGPLPQPTPQE